ncbi:YggS family pyridoxal phosphate-dependent enzyme [Wenzhouxiangella sediminis]|uniref:Pyridoxal phosphate homeostasis protein n=1 Tax=Wenzhouxiangella sediminis TaxID=1792836 RepID=A0A3E1K6L6_9GAMM|nr:YggS family pyridoxal phosphate-dependent enzyme [Wenzhouxiangella sediminis]RFF29665.1 YggS family pyridoxal phosphate-dependent enzyme [Wenzhouxiangella sediminis]
MSEGVERAAPPVSIPRTAADLARNLAFVKSRIASACEIAGRNLAEVTLLPVSKTVDEQRMRLAWQAGCTSFGENKVQEARGKVESLSDLDIRWSIIGHLQTNKAKYVARFADEFQALDRIKTAAILDRRLNIEGRSLDVFIQVNSSGEASKYGLEPEQVPDFARKLTAYPALNVRGLMTLAEFTADQARVRDCFRRMVRLRERMRQDGPQGMRFEELSMGMSGDYELAVIEGATIVRIGQAIFGPRELPDSHYWPSN